jgi:hypothetical protein
MKKIRVFPQDGINSPCYTEATAHLANQESPLFIAGIKKLSSSNPNSHSIRNSTIGGGDQDTG